MESDENIVGGSRVRFLASVERFTGVMLDRLAQSPSGKLLDGRETRLLGSVVMRSFSIWEKALSTQARDRSSMEKLQKLRKMFLEMTEKA